MFKKIIRRIVRIRSEILWFLLLDLVYVDACLFVNEGEVGLVYFGDLLKVGNGDIFGGDDGLGLGDDGDCLGGLLLLCRRWVCYIRLL